jgi:hypothetical protein
MNIVERLKDSLEYEYNLSFSERKQLLEEIDRLNNIINIKNDYIIQLHNLIYKTDNPNLQFALHIKQEKYLKELKENKYEI